MARLRPYLLGSLGLVIITFPFLWLQLQPNFNDNTIQVGWAPGHGLQFFTDLLPVFVISFLIWLGLRADRYWGWGESLEKTAAWQKTGAIWKSSWAWFAMMFVHSGPFFLSSSSF